MRTAKEVHPTGRSLRVLEKAVPLEGCLVSRLTPSKDRPLVMLQGIGQVSAYRVVAADTLGRAVLATEDVHHSCGVGRCVEPSHLVVMPMEEHWALHAETQAQEVCSTHGTPYVRRDSRGWGVCPECARESTARYRSRNPEKVKAYLESEAGKESQRRGQQRYSQKPEVKARKAEKAILRRLAAKNGTNS